MDISLELKVKCQIQIQLTSHEAILNWSTLLINFSFLVRYSENKNMGHYFEINNV